MIINNSKTSLNNIHNKTVVEHFLALNRPQYVTISTTNGIIKDNITIKIICILISLRKLLAFIHFKQSKVLNAAKKA